MILDFFEDLNNGSDKVFKQILEMHENSKKYKIEGHKFKKDNENFEINKNENMELEEAKEQKEEEEPTVDEDGFILVKKKKGKK